MPEVSNSRGPASASVDDILACEAGVRAWLASRLGDGHELDDLVQDTLLAAWRAAPSFRGLSSVSTWVHGIAKRLLWRRYREGRLRAVPCPLEDERLYAPAFGDASAFADGSGGPDGGLFLERLALEELAARLPPTDARIYEGFYRERLTVRELALGLGLPEGTVKYRLFAIRASLRARA